MTDAAPPVDGYLPVGAVTPDPARLHDLAAAPQRRQWWIERVSGLLPAARDVSPMAQSVGPTA